jgi:hypothetical protein
VIGQWQLSRKSRMRGRAAARQLNKFDQAGCWPIATARGLKAIPAPVALPTRFELTNQSWSLAQLHGRATAEGDGPIGFAEKLA